MAKNLQSLQNNSLDRSLKKHVTTALKNQQQYPRDGGEFPELYDNI